MSQIENFNQILSAFKIKATCVAFTQSERCSSYDIKLDALTKISNIEKYAKEISLALKESVTPKFNILLEKGLIQLEFVKCNDDTINYFKLTVNTAPPAEYGLPVLFGTDSYGQKVWTNLEDNPHLLVAGCTGSGKSVALHNIIANLLNFSNASIFLIDPKSIEFFEYENFKNIQVKYTYEETLNLLDELHSAMETRFFMIKNGWKKDMFNHLVVIIDEYADLSLQDAGKELYNKLCKLAQKCRAAKIHIILATQRPSAKLLDGNIKANFPARLSCKVSSKIDSKIILDSSGAEELKGKGDAILDNCHHHKKRIKIAHTSVDQIKKKFSNGN
jgi:S-DNA-T family DNA segregation ATPase FtsK/SpoIIIE